MLIVDDSRVSRMMIKSIAQNAHPDWAFLEAGDGQEAFEMVGDGKTAIQWMTLDVNMPKMDGITLAEKLRGVYPNTKMSLLTANIQTSVEKQAGVIGVGFITKPITEEKILAFLTV